MMRPINRKWQIDKSLWSNLFWQYLLQNVLLPLQPNQYLIKWSRIKPIYSFIELILNIAWFHNGKKSLCFKSAKFLNKLVPNRMLIKYEVPIYEFTLSCSQIVEYVREIIRQIDKIGWQTQRVILLSRYLVLRNQVQLILSYLLLLKFERCAVRWLLTHRAISQLYQLQ